jgi:regulation of enolase protein 1 (concanavalin A-like superfamily)
MGAPCGHLFLKKLAMPLIGAMVMAIGCASDARAVGATVPFTTYEAENGVLAGGATTIAQSGPPTSSFTSPALEASGRAYVKLDATGESVTWTNNGSTSWNGINVRYSIPDSATGGGLSSTIDLYVNGVLRQAIPVSSAQTWLYDGSGVNGTDQNPAVGNPHLFYDEVHVQIQGAAVAPGSTIALKKDGANSAAFYYIDLVDLETLPAPLTQPANSLSITDYGAVANNSAIDSFTPMQNCINAAIAQGKVVWVPAGKFYLNDRRALKNPTAVTIQGAGMWYSTLYHVLPIPSPGPNGAAFDGASTTVKNLCIDATCTGPNADGGLAGGFNLRGTNWLIDSVWIQHVGGVWASGTNGTIQNCRISNTWGDGINLNNLNDGVGVNLVAQNNFIRTTGDDCLALNSVAYNGTTTYTEMTGCKLLNNTGIAPWWANCLRVAGGQNVTVSGNYLADGVRNRGMMVAVFGANGNSLDGGVISNNTIVRGGGNASNAAYPAVTIGTPPASNYAKDVTFSGNTILNSYFNPIQVVGGTNIVLENNLVNGASLNTLANPAGILVPSATIGGTVFNKNTVQNMPAGKPAFTNNASHQNFSVGGFGNVTFTPAGALPAPWSTSDVGSVGVGGGASFDGDSFAVVGSGSDIWGTADAFRYVSQTIFGDCEIRAYVQSVQATDPWTKAGVMMRESLAANSPHASVVVTPGNGISFQWRSTAGAASSMSTAAGLKAPYWVKISRSGNNFTGSYSTDGATWTSLGTQTIAMATTFNIGLATTSHQNAQLASALIEGVTTAPIERKVSLLATVNNLWVSAGSTGTSSLIANVATPGTAESFQIVDASGTFGTGCVALRSYANNLYVTVQSDGTLKAASSTIGAAQAFYWYGRGFDAAHGGGVSLQSVSNGKWVTAENSGTSPLNANRTSAGSWETFTTKIW